MKSVDILTGEQASGSLIFALLLLAIVFWFAYKKHFFQLPPPSSSHPVSFVQTLGAFLIYLAVAIIVVPLFQVFVGLGLTGSFVGFKFFTPTQKGWMQLFSLVLLFIALVLYCFCIKRQTSYSIFWGEKERSMHRFIKTCGTGVVGWLVSYPFVLVISVITGMIALMFWGSNKVDQVAVKQLKLTMGNSSLFIWMVFAVVILVPFMEELLFRGFFQNFLKRYFKRGWAIAWTALLFAGVHYAPSQGSGNFQLLFSLLVLASFLGFIYEKAGALWAPIALHASFNAFNVLMIALAGS